MEIILTPIAIKAEFLIGHTTISQIPVLLFSVHCNQTHFAAPCAKADSISLNTGVDHATGMFYSPGSPDAIGPWCSLHTPIIFYLSSAYAMATLPSGMISRTCDALFQMD